MAYWGVLLRFAETALVALLVLPLFAAAAWVAHRSRTMREDPAGVLNALRATHGPTLPSAEEVGATARSRPESFDRATLYEYIDGAAEAYLSHGFRRCLVADYTFSSEVEATVEIYRFDGPQGAAKQLAVETPRNAKVVSGTESTISDGDVLLSLRDRDLLKATVLTPGPGAATALERIAAAWRKVP